MVHRFTVSTECPNCAAPLDFTEGSNAVRCLHCQSNLLVTGRKRVLTYFVAPKLDAQEALAKVLEAQARSKYRVAKTQLYFIPYYRFTGHDLRWEEEVVQRPKPALNGHLFSSPVTSDHSWGSTSSSDDFFSLLQSTSEILRQVFGGGGVPSVIEDKTPSKPPAKEQAFELKEAVRAPGLSPRALLKGPDGMTLAEHYLEKNFIALSLDGVGLYSLGVRPSVLRLELFRRAVLHPLGKIVQPNLSPKAALDRGLKTEKSHALIYRKVVGGILSMIYFPFWVVEVEHAGKTLLAILDAVSQSVIKLDAGPELYSVLDHEPRGDPPVVGFRPLICPNCGWDLPVRPEDVIFVCSSCNKAWQILGNNLGAVACQVAESPKTRRQDKMKYLPFWVLNTEKMNEKFPSLFFLPAFRYRRLKYLSDLARAISLMQPSYSLLEGERPKLHGCYYDQEDAVMLAQFTRASLIPRNLEGIKALQKDELTLTGATLTWLPFEIRANALVDPLTGLHLPQNLLL